MIPLTDDPIPELAAIRLTLQWRATGMGDSVGALRSQVGAGGRQVGAIADLCRLAAECWHVVYAHVGTDWEWTQPDAIAELGWLRTWLSSPARRDFLLAFIAFDEDCWALVARWRPRVEDGRRLPEEAQNNE